jgi:hypothetical protein
MNEKWWKIVHYYLFLNISFVRPLGVNMERYNCPWRLAYSKRLLNFLNRIIEDLIKINY